MEIFVSKKLAILHERQFCAFLQKMANRIGFGWAQYKNLRKEETKYLTRLRKEVQAYVKTGNAEHLYNIANYAYLETLIPQHRNFHFDNRVDSVTRGKI